MYRLGLLYESGVGADPNQRMAYHWLHRAALAGDAAAQYEYGRRCERDDTADAPQTEAVGWYKRAALQGHKRAQYRIGICYVRGTAVERELTEGSRGCPWPRSTACAKRVINWDCSRTR